MTRSKYELQRVEEKGERPTNEMGKKKNLKEICQKEEEFMSLKRWKALNS